MTGNATKTEAVELHDLSSEELNAVSGGFMRLPLVAVKVLEIKGGGTGGGEGGQNDPAQMFQQIMQQLTQQG
jgi:hypothetical protein